jgi:hypothetical protein
MICIAGANASAEGWYPGTGRQNSSWAGTGLATAQRPVARVARVQR